MGNHIISIHSQGGRVMSTNKVFIRTIISKKKSVRNSQFSFNGPVYGSIPQATSKCPPNLRQIIFENSTNLQQKKNIFYY